MLPRITERCFTLAALLALAATVVAAQGPEPKMAGPTAFTEQNGKKPYNASGLVALADSRFLFCDNNAHDALYEIDLTPSGEMKGGIVPHPLVGRGLDAVDDIEGLTVASEHGRQYVFATSSLGMKTSKKTGESNPLVGLVRVRPTSRTPWRAEVMPGFREWLIRHVPSLEAAAALDPDSGGLNVEGLAWDPKRHALLFGVRTPVDDGTVTLIPVHVKNLAGPWRTSNLEVRPEIHLAITAEGAASGVRAIEYDSVRKCFLVVVGRAISKTVVPFRLYTWDGNPEGAVARLGRLEFDPAMKPEGVAAGTIEGRRATVFVDDEGGYMVLWGDDPRLRE